MAIMQQYKKNLSILVVGKANSPINTYKIEQFLSHMLSKGSAHEEERKLGPSKWSE